MQHPDDTRHNCPTDECWFALLLVLLNRQRRDQTTAESRLCGDQWERQTGGWQACVWSRGETGNRCVDRAAVIRAQPARCDRTRLTDGSQLDVHVWLSGPVGTPHCWYHLANTRVSKGSPHRYKVHPSPQNPGHRWQQKQLCTHETGVLTGNHTINAHTAYKMKRYKKVEFIYMEFVHQHDSCLKNKLLSINGRSRELVGVKQSTQCRKKTKRW